MCLTCWKGDPGSLGSGQGVQGGAAPPRRAVRCLSSVSLLSVEDTGRGSMRDRGLAKQAGACGLGLREAFCFGLTSESLLTEAVSPGCRAVLLMPAGARPRPASRLVQEPGLP